MKLSPLALLLLPACAYGPADRAPMNFEVIGSDDTFDAATKAAAQWNTVCGTDITVTRAKGGIPIVEVPMFTTPSIADVSRTRILVERNRYAEVALARAMGAMMGAPRHTCGGIMGGATTVTSEDCPP